MGNKILCVKTFVKTPWFKIDEDINLNVWKITKDSQLDLDTLQFKL